MRFEGTLVRWDDVRGIGHIESSQGGEPLFVHISALPTAGGRPRQGERFSFEIEPNPRGGKQAVRGRKLPPLGRPVLVPVGESKWSDAAPRSAPMPLARDPARPTSAAPTSAPTTRLPLGQMLRGVTLLAVVALAIVVAVPAWRAHNAARLDNLPATAAGAANLAPETPVTPVSPMTVSTTSAATPVAPAAAPQALAPAPAAQPVDYSTPQVSYRCDGRMHCSQMRSCNEARYFLAHCPGVKMDGDGNGIPCEEQLCGH